jgi:hypothetical protein
LRGSPAVEPFPRPSRLSLALAGAPQRLPSANTCRLIAPESTPAKPSGHAATRCDKRAVSTLTGTSAVCQPLTSKH